MIGTERTSAEIALEHKYLGQIVAYEPSDSLYVCGRVESIALETFRTEPQVILRIGNSRYTCDYQYVNDYLKVLS